MQVNAGAFLEQGDEVFDSGAGLLRHEQPVAHEGQTAHAESIEIERAVLFQELFIAGKSAGSDDDALGLDFKLFSSLAASTPVTAPFLSRQYFFSAGAQKQLNAEFTALLGQHFGQLRASSLGDMLDTRAPGWGKRR